jgi:hypothetical protein
MKHSLPKQERLLRSSVFSFQEILIGLLGLTIENFGQSWHLCFLDVLQDAIIRINKTITNPKNCRFDRVITIFFTNLIII